MQISIETTTGLERRMTVEVPAAIVESAVNARLQEAAGNVRLNGFRKGKVPLKVIQGRYGKGVRQEVVGEVMSKTYYQAISEQNLKPTGQPRIEPKSLEEGKNLAFVAIFEVFPEITLKDFGKLKVEKLVADVGDENIDKMIETLRQQRQSWEPITRQSKNKDRITIDYIGTMNGEAFNGGSAQGANLVLGSARMIEGFEKGLLKKKAGDEVVLDLVFPEDYQNKELAGKPVKFEIKINSVNAPVLPELNDEFFAVFGIEDGGIDAFRKEVAANMSRELNNASKAKLKNRVMDLLLAQNEVALPSVLVKNEIEALRQQALQQFGGGKKNVDPSMLPDELFREQAEKRIALGLILGEVIKSKGLKADPAQVKSTIEDIASTYESPEQVVRWYYSNKEQLASVESSVLEDQAFDAILAEAKVTEKSVSYDDVIKPDAPKTGK